MFVFTTVEQKKPFLKIKDKHLKLKRDSILIVHTHTHTPQKV